MSKEMNPDTNFKIIDRRSPDTQARKAGTVDHVGETAEVVLKPCPFCGGEAEVYAEECVCDNTRWRARCKNNTCDTATIWHLSQCDAIAAWNRRTPEQGTSVVRWVRFNGREETLPEIFHKVLLRDADSFARIPIRGQGRRGDKWFFEDDTQREIEIGDEWCYWPVPPESAG